MASTSSHLAPGSPASATPGDITDSRTPAAATLLIALAPLSHEAFEATLANLSTAFTGGTVLVSTPDVPTAPSEPSGPHAISAFATRYPNLHLLTDAPATQSPAAWVLTAADFVNAFKLAQQHDASACLLLGAESNTLTPDALRALASAVVGDGTDLAVPRYDLGPRDGLVNSAMLYPISRAVYGARPRFPLAIDLGLSLRMAERLATSAQKFTAAGQNDALIWPVAEACVAGYSVVEVPIGTRTIPVPTTDDLNSLLARILSSLFSDVEARASFWQRSRIAQPSAKSTTAPAAPDSFADYDVQPMLEAFSIAYKNLHEIWSLVLPPNSLLGLKRLSQMPPEAFRLADALWVRIVYDFLLAYRLRTINRGHLLGALTPLYLAWVASHILLARNGTDPERHVEEVAQAFEFDKPYLVSRWRWPDRFNP